MIVQSKPISRQNFVRYGSVVTRPGGTPTSQSADYKFWSDIADYAIQGETEIGICTVYRQPKIEISGMERHLRTPEILVPIDAPFVLPLLIEGDTDEKAEAFRVDVGEAVVISSAVWHGACVPVGNEESSYFVIFRKNTPHEDVVKKEVKKFEVWI